MVRVAPRPDLSLLERQQPFPFLTSITDQPGTDQDESAKSRLQVCLQVFGRRSVTGAYSKRREGVFRFPYACATSYLARLVMAPVYRYIAYLGNLIGSICD